MPNFLFLFFSTYEHLKKRASRMRANDSVIGCEDVMAILDECHARGFLHKALGGCNEAKQDVNLCLRAERLERQAKNREIAKQKRAKIKAVWDEIDQNS